MERVQNLLRTGLVAIELVGNVRLAMHRATRCQGYDPAQERTPDRLLDGQPHPADLLHEELTAARSAFVVREDVGHPAVGKDVDEERLPAQRCHGVELGGAGHLAEGALDSGDLRDLAHGTGHAEKLTVGELRCEQLLENFQRAPLMGDDPCQYAGGLECNHLDRQRTDVYPDNGHGFTSPAFKVRVDHTTLLDAETARSGRMLASNGDWSMTVGSGEGRR